MEKNTRKIFVLGTEYQVFTKVKLEDDLCLKEKQLAGYCNSISKTIVIGDASTFESCKYDSPSTRETYEKATLRHEIVHAFMYESGLDSSALTYDGPWATNEEMIDWFAAQGQKIFSAWEDADAL